MEHILFGVELFIYFWSNDNIVVILDVTKFDSWL